MSIAHIDTLTTHIFKYSRPFIIIFYYFCLIDFHILAIVVLVMYRQLIDLLFRIILCLTHI